MDDLETMKDMLTRAGIKFTVARYLRTDLCTDDGYVYHLTVIDGTGDDEVFEFGDSKELEAFY